MNEMMQCHRTVAFHLHNIPQRSSLPVKTSQWRLLTSVARNRTFHRNGLASSIVNSWLSGHLTTLYPARSILVLSRRSWYTFVPMTPEISSTAHIRMHHSYNRRL